MTIEKGRDWGEAGVVPADVRTATCDAEVADHLDAVISVVAGDLHRGLGEPRRAMVGQPCTFLTVDALRVEVETDSGETVVFAAVAHVCVGDFGARGIFEAVVNAGFVNGVNLTPRGHPGDGRIELIRVEPGMTWRQRVMARRRARTGTHLPHPSISVSVVESWTVERRGRQRLRVDGVDVAAWRRAKVTILPGRVRLVV